MKIKNLLVAITLSASILWQQGVAMARERAKIQIAIALDSSNSMDGLIDRTRTQIWKIVNVLTGVTKNGQVPDLQIALYQYGNKGLVSLPEVSLEALPPEMQNMTLGERENYVAAMKAQRIAIQNRMQELDRLRKEYVSRKTRGGMNGQPNNTLESVMLQTLQQQLAAKGFELNQ